MNQDDTSMWDDPAESSALRRLLRAGRETISDYNVERGVVQHLANLQAGVPLPEWAAGLATAKSASLPVAVWLAVPLLAASSLLGVWWANQRADAHRPVVQGAPMASLENRAPRAVPATIASADESAAFEHAAAPSLRAHPRVSELAFQHGEARVAALVSPRTSNHVGPLRHPQADNDSEATQLAPAALEMDVHAAVRSDNAPSGEPLRAAAPSTVASVPAAPAFEQRAESAVDPAAEEERADEQPEASERVAHPAAAPAPALADDESRLEREMQMLAVTQRVLGQDPARALRLARQGEHEFPSSMFSAERKQLALLALVGLGRVDEARRMGRPFLAAYPNAPWSARLRSALATGRLPAP